MTRKTSTPGSLHLNRPLRLALVAAMALLLPAAGATALIGGLGDPLGAVSSSQQVSTPAGQVTASADGTHACAGANLSASGVSQATGIVGSATGTATGAVGSLPGVGGITGTAAGATQQIGATSVSSHNCFDIPVAVPEAATPATSSSGGGLSSAIHGGVDAIGAAVKSAWDSIAALF